MHPEIEAFARSLLLSKLRRCTQPQQELFGRIWPCGVDKIPTKALENAIGICERTIKKNEKL